ncbi:protein ligase UBR1 [Seminavis robusta]|uniref:E3 ubiquitin-protein ligase n=1 Tax=Seminavis robusta TaxID=568900 RepID=A0A9N8DYS7_9STRA|nr:protein ligase UBR1 [Seminavis robusta]|eukprot:Sro397_g134410.1 protein ligase UBR1 (1717) ;mRNA; r:5156-10735
MALNYSSTPLCQRFRDLDLTLVQLSAAGLSVGLGARKVFELLKSRFSMDGYLCDPERRTQIGSNSPSSGSYGSGSNSQWVNPPRMQDPDHAVVLSESFFLTLCMLVTELPPPPPSSEKDDTWLRLSIRRELIHALVAEARSHSEAMAAASCAVSRRDESDGTALSSGGGSLFREAFSDVLQEIGKQKSQGSSRVSSGPPAFELKAKFCDEYDPTFFHLRRPEHQHAMDVVARLRKTKSGEDEAGDAFCLPLVCAPPKAHPRFLPCRLLLHLQGMDAALRRALLFALTGGSWLPPSEPETDACLEDAETSPEQPAGAESSTVPRHGDVPAIAFGGRRSLSTPLASTSSSFKRSLSEGDRPPPFSPDVVAASSVSFLEVLQLLTLQVHTLEECASLHHSISDLDDEAKLFSAGLSINSYLGRLVHVPDSLAGIWAFRPHPHGPLTSSGSGANRGAILGLLIALYEHRSDHGAILDSGGGKDYGQGDSDHGGARALASSGLKWLLRFVNALVDGAHSVGAAVKSATTGVPVNRSSQSANENETVWTIDEKIRSTIRGMLSGLPELWPAPREPGSTNEGKTNDKAGGGNALDDADDEEERTCALFADAMTPMEKTMAHSVIWATCNEVPRRRNMGCQLRESEAMDSRPLSCLPRGSIVTVLKIAMLDKYDILSRRVLVKHVSIKPQENDLLTEGWASVQSSQGYIILSPLASVCYTNSRWGGTRPIIRQCGHAAHLKCVEAHTLSLHQRAAGEQPYDGRFAANIDDGEFLCPLCKQLSNILIPRDNFVDVAPSDKSGEVTMQDADPAPASDGKTGTLRSGEPFSSFHDKIAMGANCTAKRLKVIGKEALKDFGAHLFQAMDVPWERQLGWRSQNQLHPAILRWDYEEEDDPDDDNKDGDAAPKEAPHGKSILRLLRQQHIAWAALGHSAAALEASTRGTEEVLPFGTMVNTSDPWSDFKAEEKDKHPMLLELKRTVAGVSGLYEVLVDEVSSELGFEKLDSKTPSIVGVLLADIFDGNNWFHTLSSDQNIDKDTLMLWSKLTGLMASIPCHVARDGQISKRSEARASAAAMWTVKGLGTQRRKRTDPPAPLAVAKVFDSIKKKYEPADVNPGWGTLDPQGCGSDPRTPFRPAVASAFLYTPLLAWDLSTFSGAMFSAVLVNDVAALPTSKELLYLAQSLLVSRMIQAIITPGGIVPGSEMDIDGDGMEWPQQDIQREGSALLQLATRCRNKVTEVALQGSTFLDDLASVEALPMFSSVGEALLPLSRSIILLLRACTGVIRERQRLCQIEPAKEDEFDQRLDTVVYSSDIMSSDDGFLVYKAIGGPLPSSILQESNPWWTKITKWLIAVSIWEAHHGSSGRNVVPLIANIAGVSPRDPTITVSNRLTTADNKDVNMRAVDGTVMESKLNDAVTTNSVGVKSSSVDHNGSIEDMNESDDDEIVEGMELDNEIPVVDLPDSVAGHDAPAARQGQSGSQFRSEDSSEEGSHSDLKDEGGQSDREFAYVSRSPIISYQPSVLGLVGIGAIRQGTFFESQSANSVMSDLSHLGLLHSREIPTFSLVRLPSSFVELYSIVNKVKGRDETNLVDESDDVSTSETAICLVSGTVLRSGSTRRSFSTRAARPPGACTLHARKTGSGIGIFFLVQKCTVLLMHNNKSAYSASLYVDEHGEEDPGLRRGRPLFLNQARYRALEVLWRQQGIPREVAQIRSTSDRVIRDNWY